MPLLLPGLIEYLVAQERPGGGGRLTHVQALQYQSYVPPATAAVQSLNAITTSPRPNDFADIGFHIALDRRFPPDVLDVSIFQYGTDPVTAFIATDTIEDGIGNFLVVTRDQPIRWEVENLSLFPMWLVATLHYLAVASIDDLALVRKHIQAYSRGPYWDPTQRYAGLSVDELIGRVDRALRGS